jgi:iron-sulfur cluster repair protein YtfE (RIC family)
MRMNEPGIVPEMSALSLLKARPSVLSRLERWGIDPWLDPDARLGTLAASLGLPWSVFAAALASVPSGAGRADLENAPLPEILDYLVADHREILGELVPAIRTALACLPPGPDGAPAGLDGIWNAFTSGLEAHMREEESFLFPRLLHYLHCLRHHGQHPDFAGGSVNVYIAIRLLGNERLQMDALRRLLQGRNALAARPGTGSAEQENLLASLAVFEARLERHNHEEEKILYPIARELEKSLYDAAIAGAGRGDPGPIPEIIFEGEGHDEDPDRT